jgi:succinate dehydrogenase / fumarate reductase cytochrome b subunit
LEFLAACKARSLVRNNQNTSFSSHTGQLVLFSQQKAGLLIRVPEDNMKWFLQTLAASLGLKLMMALSGLCFCLFLIVHTFGNLTIYGGQAMFNSYAEHLHALGILLTIAEWGLVILAAVHIVTGLTLFIQNLIARPVRYKVNHRAGGRTIGSATMPYTGALLLIFIVIHLLNFHFVDKSHTTIFDIVRTAFQSPVYIGLYMAGVLLAAVHVSHGLWSAFQTLGANHPKYMPTIRVLSIGLALAIGGGLGLLPIYISISA